MTRQPVHAAGRGHEPDARLGQAQRGVLGGDDDVARERDLEPAAEREAVHRGDDRLHQIEARGEAAEAGLRHARHAVLGGPLEIVAGRERALARAGEDRDPAVGVGREVVPDPLELLVRRRMQRVHHLRGG